MKILSLIVIIINNIIIIPAYCHNLLLICYVYYHGQKNGDITQKCRASSDVVPASASFLYNSISKA